VKRAHRTAALVAALSILAGACTRSPRTTLRIRSAGGCTPVDVSAAPETAWLLQQAADEFNASPAARTPSGGCTFVRVQSLDAPAALRELLAGWPDAATLGPAPSAWVPPSSAWSALLNARLIAHGDAPFATTGTSFARTPVVVAMPAAMAEAMGYPARAIGWADLGRLAANPAGWAAYGHPEWGAFHLGFPNPNWSTPGLDASVALYATPALAAPARALQRSVVYYTDAAQRYLDTWVRLSAGRDLDAMRFVSAVVTDERTVVSFNEGRTDSSIPDPGRAKAPGLPLVAISPRDGAVAADNPIVVLDAPWTASAARAGAQAFARFALGKSTQADVAAGGFRPVRGPVDTTVLNARNGVRIGRGAPISQLAISPVDAQRAINGWQSDRRPARVLVLFDESDSMGDHAATSLPGHPTKIALARPALTAALAELAPTDQVGVRAFGTALPRGTGARWVDVARVTPFGPARGRLLKVVNALAPHGGSPLYAATHDAYDAMARHLDRTRIDAVVLVTDGYNEDEHNSNLAALLAHLNPRVRVFTVAFSNDADFATLQKIAAATTAQAYDARDPALIGDALARAFASF
jgi:Ca-activated chloride channel family protein